MEFLNPPNEPEDFPEKLSVPPGEVRIGIYQHHPYYQCEHMNDVVVLPLNINGWHVDCEDPLTVTPSILNGSCGCHGFITNGVWIAV